MRTFIVAAALVGTARAYISPVTAGQVLTQDFLDNEVIVSPGDNIGCLSYPVNFSHADITNNFLGGIDGFPLTPGGCYNAVEDMYEACPSMDDETIKLEGVAEDPSSRRIDCIVSLDLTDPLSTLYTTVEGNNGRQIDGTLFSIGVLSRNKAAPLLFTFFYADGSPATLPEFVFALLDSDSDGPDGTTDLSLWPGGNTGNENFIDEVSLREYVEIKAMGDGQLYAYYTSTDTQVIHQANTPEAGWVTVKSDVFGAGAPPVLETGGVDFSYACESDWNDADDNSDKTDFLERITPTENTCDDGNPLDPITINGREFTAQQANRAVFFRFFNTQQLKVRLYTVGQKSAREVSRNYLWTGINQPFPCPPPPSAPPSAPPPPFCDVCTERDPACTDECVECLDLAINKDGCCTQECIACLEDKYSMGMPSSECASTCSGCGADYAAKCGPVEACSMRCSAAGMDYAEQCGPFVICEFCDRMLEDKPYCLRECSMCPPIKLLCSDCAMPDYPLKDDVRCSTEGPYACVEEFDVECSTSPLNSLCPNCGGDDIEYCLDCFPPTPPMPPPFPPPFPPKAALKYDKQRYDPNRHFNHL